MRLRLSGRGSLDGLGDSILAASSTSPGNRSITGARNAVICGRGLKNELYILQHEEEASTNVIHGTSAAAAASTSTVTAMAAHVIIENHPSEGNTKETAINGDLEDSRLQTRPMEATIELLSMKLELLQAENHRIKALASESLGTKRELQSARLEIKHLKRRLRSSRAQARRKMESLERKIAQANENEEIGTEVRRKMKELEDLQASAEELRKANFMMKQENLDLEQRMESAKMLVSVLEDPQTEALEEINHLRQSNAKLQKKIEKLEAIHRAEADELRHLRWLNTKLSKEYLSSKHPFPGMTKTGNKDRQKRVSPIHDDFKPKQQQLQHRYSNSPQGSVLEFSDSRRATTDRASPKKSIDDSRKLKILCKFKKLVSRKNSKGNNSFKSPLMEPERRSISSRAGDKTSGSVSARSDERSSAASYCMTTEDQYMASPMAGIEPDANEKWSSSSAWINGAFHSRYAAPS